MLAQESRTLVKEWNENSSFCVGTFPRKYIQGPGVLRKIDLWTSTFGEKAMLVGGSRALSVVENTITGQLSSKGVKVVTEPFGGDSTEEEIERICCLVESQGADFLIGAGGGKAIDTVKAVSFKLNRPVSIIPTVASTDAPTSTVVVIYGEKGEFLGYIKLPFNPDVVVVDTSVIVQAPFRYLAAGIGGAIGVCYEAPVAAGSKAVSTAGGCPLKSAVLLADGIKEVLLKHALAAKWSVERGVVTGALEAVVEAVLLMSGIGFESGGLAAAHAVYHGYRSLKKTNPKLHGELVAFGTIVQMILLDHPWHEIEEILSLFHSIGLPLTFEDIGISGEEVDSIADVACKEGTVKNVGFIVSGDEFAGAMQLADRIGQKIRDCKS
ncbi:MAG: glycerol dehydrogenase [Bacillota bacterium]